MLRPEEPRETLGMVETAELAAALQSAGSEVVQGLVAWNGWHEQCMDVR